MAVFPPLAKETPSPLVPPPCWPTTDACSPSRLPCGVTASASTLPPSWCVNTVAPCGGAGNPVDGVGDAAVADEPAGGATDVVVATGPGVSCSRTTTTTIATTPTTSAATAASSRRTTAESLDPAGVLLVAASPRAES